MATSLMVSGCVTSQSRSARAMEACFDPPDRPEWRIIPNPPISSEEISDLMTDAQRAEPIPSNQVSVYWFAHDENRYALCALRVIRGYPPDCGRDVAEFTRSGVKWELAPLEEIIFCDKWRDRQRAPALNHSS